MSEASGHLDGCVVLDLSSVGPAARASRILADYGATVVKVQPTSAKRGLQIEPPDYSYGAGRGTKRVRIDLKAPEGKQAFLRLAAKADVLIESFRPGAAARMGLGYDDVRRANARIVYCSTSGYGQTGERATWTGHDLNYLAIGGYLACSSPRADGMPAIPGATVADSAAGGMQAAIAILAALLRRERTGVGEYLDVAVADGVLALMSLHIDRYLATGEETTTGNDILTGRYAFYDIYATRDGGFLAVAAIEPAFFANLCELLDCEQFIDSQMDDSKQDEIRHAFSEAFARKDRDQWVAELASADTCVAPVLSVAEVAGDEHLAARKVFAEARSAARGKFRQLSAVLAGCRRDLPVHEVADRDASDTDELLRGAGLLDAEIRRLHEAGVVE